LDRIYQSDNFDEREDDNEGERNQEIEDSSIFGLTPTPKPETNKMSRTTKAPVKASKNIKE
jgi:hypothetical protein